MPFDPETILRSRMQAYENREECFALARERAKKIRFLVLDVDGVCTDGKIYYNSAGETVKCFNSLDGIGIISAIRANINVGIITGRNDPCVEARMRPLGISEYHAGNISKLDALQTIAKRQKVTFAEMAYIGDDWVDLDPLLAVGLPIAVANARPEVKAISLWQTSLRGGDGAVREAVDFILDCQRLFPAAQWVHEVL